MTAALPEFGCHGPAGWQARSQPRRSGSASLHTAIPYAPTAR